MQPKYTKAQIAEKKNEAAKLIAGQGWPQKDAAIHLGISLKTMCKWAKKYGWNEGNKATAYTPQQLLNINAFEAYLKAISEEDCQTFKRHKEAYFKANKQPPMMLVIC
jgi:transposase